MDMKLKLKEDQHIPSTKQIQMKQDQCQAQYSLNKELFGEASSSSEGDLGKGEIRVIYMIPKIHTNRATNWIRRDHLRQNEWKMDSLMDIGQNCQQQNYSKFWKIKKCYENSQNYA